MMQVITPPAIDAKEQETKDWFQAQKVRQFMNHLQQWRGELLADVRLTTGKSWSTSIMGRTSCVRAFNGLVPEAQRIGLKSGVKHSSSSSSAEGNDLAMRINSSLLLKPPSRS